MEAAGLQETGAELEGGAQFVDDLLGAARVAQVVAAAELAEVPADIADAERGAAGEGRVGEQEGDDVPWLEAGLGDAAEGVVAGGSAQDGVPVGQVEDTALFPAGGKQHVILDVEQAGDLVGAFEQAAKHVEMPALISGEGAFGDAGVGLDAFLNAAAEAGEGVALEIGRGDLEHGAMEHVELHPHLGADERAQGAGVGAG